MCWVDIVIPIVSSIIGGLLTLGGVFLSIKHSDKTIQKERLESFVPVVRCFNQYDNYDYKNAKSVYFDKEFDCELSRGFWGIFFNTEKANFEIKSLLVNGESVKATVNKYIRKGEFFDISTKVPYTESSTKITLKIQDDYGTMHEYKILFEVNENGMLSATSIEKNKI